VIRWVSLNCPRHDAILSLCAPRRSPSSHIQETDQARPREGHFHLRRRHPAPDRRAHELDLRRAQVSGSTYRDKRRADIRRRDEDGEQLIASRMLHLLPTHEATCRTRSKLIRRHRLPLRPLRVGEHVRRLRVGRVGRAEIAGCHRVGPVRGAGIGRGSETQAEGEGCEWCVGTEGMECKEWVVG
jgi:hypothetical protein